MDVGWEDSSCRVNDVASDVRGKRRGVMKKEGRKALGYNLRKKARKKERTKEAKKERRKEGKK
jgi:hypothetical protein